MVLCLEIKGGRVSRQDGIWCFTNRYGQETRKVESPFAQASSGMYSLKSDIEGRFGQNLDLVFAYGVVFPDITFDVKSPEWDEKIIYDIRDAKQPFYKYIERVVGYWREKSRTRGIVTTVNKKDIVDYLRGDFEIATLLWGEIQEMENAIGRFTTEQFRALDHMEGNARMIFTGAAGTGKTMLAMEKARRLACNKEKVLVLCYNRLLGARLVDEAMRIDSGSDFVQANSIHKYFASVIETVGMSGELKRRSAGKKPEEVFNNVFPEIFIEAVEQGAVTKVQSLIIDEGQDLLSENYLLALDSVLEGGLSGGNWTVFLDPGGQAKLFNRFSIDAYNYLKKLGAPEYRLDMNCRNTLQVATQAAIVSGFPLGKTRLDGPKVEYKTYRDDEDAAIQVVELVERLLREESIPPNSITILSARKIGSMSLLSSGIRLPSYFIEAEEVNICALPKDRVPYATAAAFKGLENNVIIYTDIDSLAGQWSESVNYVGMTRAREKLYVFLDKKLQKQYGERAKQFAGLNI